jgi:C-terminal processing protease CtpA/Prc
MTRTASAPEDWAKTAGGDGNYVRALPDRRALYLSIDAMEDAKDRSFADLTRQAFAAFDQPELDRLVVDLRRNGGGDNFNGEAMRKGIAHSRFNRPGGLYVLTSPQTFSAAQNLSTRLERETDALFVGAPTAGAPNHCGDAAVFTGASTGVTAIISSKRWSDSYPPDKRIWILPDLPVPNLFTDWAAGRDPVLDMALSHTVSGPTDDRTFFFSRASQKGDWRPFWRQA